MWLQISRLNHGSNMPSFAVLPPFSNVLWDIESYLTFDQVMEPGGKSQQKV